MPNGSWQSDKDMPHRREMIQHIVKMLKKDKNGSPEWLSKLPQMAKQLEVSLYRNARSFEAYTDMSTLKMRLQQIAVEVSRKAKHSSGSSDDRRRPDSQPMYPPNGMVPASQEMMRPNSRGTASPFVGNSSSTQSQQQRQVVKMDEINPMAGGGGPSTGGGGEMPRRSNAPPGYHGSSRGSSSMEPPPSGRSSSGQNTSSSSGVIPAGNRNDPEWKVRIRHKQQRLLLLHHAAKCPHNDGRCPTTPHCADMKTLWKHMEGCKDNNCRISHCFSSRAILSHYRKCKDPQCPACGPVRDTVRKTGKSSGASSTSVRSRNGENMNLMMNGGPTYPPPPPQQRNMMESPVGGATYTSASSGTSAPFPAPGRQSHSSMPPPANNRQYSSSSSAQYRPSSKSGASSSGPAAQAQRSYPQDPKNIESRRSSSADPRMPASSGSTSTGPRRNDSEWQKVRHKQQRLLLLRHASKCSYEAGKCPVTPHCASMKKLWEHIAHCKNHQCTVQHCMSSRYVLSHYRRCKDPRCLSCGPVRDAIRKSHEKEKSSSNSVDPEQAMLMSIAQNMSAAEHQALSFQPEPKRIKSSHRPSTSTVISARGPLPSVPPAPYSEHSSAAPKSLKQSKSAVSDSSSKSESSSKTPDDHSLINSFTVEQIENHIAALNKSMQLSPAKLKSKCSEVLKGLQNHQHGWVFNNPVDPVELGLNDYFLIIQKPMDLGTVNKKLDNGVYHTVDDFMDDVNLTFNNAMQYNEQDSVVHDMAKELKAKAATDHKKLLMKLEAEDREKRMNERACTLCGEEKLLFEPPVFFCNGLNCQSQRIRRNSHFYVGGNNQYFWCNPCYNELDSTTPIELMDMSIMKSDLMKRKNDEVHEESWVECDGCKRWVHQICGLFNTRQNKEYHTKYFCPLCLLKRRKMGAKNTPSPPSATSLPRTKLSEALEEHVREKVEKKKTELIREKCEREKITPEEAIKALGLGGPVIIRQVTSTDRKLEVRERMKQRYAHKKYPDEFPFRCKCIVVFQTIDGVDVILFALYVYEHGDDNPEPNKRVVYISYLDSVYFMRPRRLRTFVYHEILIRYLDYARAKGFASAHIWACPPLKGDDYIFYAKPEDQKTPRDARLRQWYIDMLQECQRRSIVGKLTNMYDLYFANDKIDATAVPYLEGDYFPGEAENVIKEVEEGKSGKKASSSKNKKKQSKSKSNRGTRATGIDEEALINSGILDGKVCFEENARDPIMVKLGETVQPMKESFIVAFLACKDAKPENLVVPEEIEEARKELVANGTDVKPANRKRGSDGNVRKGGSSNKTDDSEKIIDDDAEEMDCEFLNNRQAFLNLCRGNHYQFDELRRAKHTSMMVLWHLHNRDAPKFVQQCASCLREILTGTRFHCDTCTEYDICEDCFKSPNCNRGACTHKLRPIAVEGEGGRAGGLSGKSEAEQTDRQRNLMLHIQLIEHASSCKSSKCSSTNCAKMKSYLAHGRQCKLKASGGCKVCKRIWTLLRIHAQKCKAKVCPVPQCVAIRERIRQLAKQQQAMDDRRRQEMNRHYRMNMMSQN